jgi:hypothetical protein
MTNTKFCLAKTTAIACLGLRKGLEPSHVLGVKGDFGFRAIFENAIANTRLQTSDRSTLRHWNL